MKNVLLVMLFVGVCGFVNADEFDEISKRTPSQQKAKAIKQEKELQQAVVNSNKRETERKAQNNGADLVYDAKTNKTTFKWWYDVENPFEKTYVMTGVVTLKANDIERNFSLEKLMSAKETSRLTGEIAVTGDFTYGRKAARLSFSNETRVATNKEMGTKDIPVKTEKHMIKATATGADPVYYEVDINYTEEEIKPISKDLVVTPGLKEGKGATVITTVVPAKKSAFIQKK